MKWDSWFLRRLEYYENRLGPLNNKFPNFEGYQNKKMVCQTFVYICPMSIILLCSFFPFAAAIFRQHSENCNRWIACDFCHVSFQLVRTERGEEWAAQKNIGAVLKSVRLSECERKHTCTVTKRLSLFRYCGSSSDSAQKPYRFGRIVSFLLFVPLSLSLLLIRFRLYFYTLQCNCNVMLSLHVAFYFRHSHHMWLYKFLASTTFKFIVTN